MISSLLWLPRGQLNAKPEPYMPTEEEMGKEVREYADEFEAEYNEEGDFMDAMMKEQMDEMDIADLDYTEDPDLDDVLKQTDHILCVGKVGEVSTIEYQIFDIDQRSLYIHRDLMLPSIPLCSEFVNPFLIVGSFEPVIEMWNANFYDKLTPDVELKGHTDAVLSLSSNSIANNVLLSGSSDCTVKLWDISKAKVVDTFNHHADKVQTIKWHFSEATVLATGGFDGLVYVGDTRSKTNFSKIEIGGEIERLDWGFKEYELIISNNNGEISCYDIRSMERLYTIGLSNACTFAKSLGNLLVIASPQDHSSNISIWKVSDKPERLYLKSVDGNVLDIKSCPENPELIAIGGNNSQIWDLSSIKKLRKLIPELDALERRDDGIFTPYDFDDENQTDDEIEAKN
eukprot:NODE_283_length_11832_cov_0.293190.p2 type:complete len:400 gc:universal NODE_283_length_11832_cov_0.293190:619-1818(+)